MNTIGTGATGPHDMARFNEQRTAVDTHLAVQLTDDHLEVTRIMLRAVGPDKVNQWFDTSLVVGTSATKRLIAEVDATTTVDSYSSNDGKAT